MPAKPVCRQREICLGVGSRKEKSAGIVTEISVIRLTRLQESDSSSTAVSVDKRLKRQYGSRRKTDELMNYADSTKVSEPSTLPTVLEVQQSKELGDADASRARKVGVSSPFNADCIVSWVGKGWLGYQRQYLKRKHQRRHPNRRSHCHFTREPFDVDSLLGLSPFDTFEKVGFQHRPARYFTSFHT